jgi:radical SAM protein with 4Fe4S-binding SPASM domain
MIDDLAGFGCPVLLISGGEPLMRPDLLERIDQARQAGMRAVVSTNGTLITPTGAQAFARAGLSYVGVSLDGLRNVNDAFRGMDGAFDRAMEGIAMCQQAGVKVGLRMTLNRRNVADLDGIFDLIENRRIPRICFYHLAYAGRGGAIRSDALDARQTRSAVDLIIDRTAALHSQGKKVEVLTVDNHVDGPYLYMRLTREDPARAANALQLLRMNGGNSSGVGIGAVSWNGDVHPDQFWRNHTVGNVKERPFSRIWTDPDQPLLAKLRDRKEHLNCRCTRCRFLPVCNGNLRARAEAATGDPWGDDPACYLTDEEIAGELPE